MWVICIVELDEGETRFIPLLNDKDSISEQFLGKYKICFHNFFF